VAQAAGIPHGQQPCQVAAQHDFVVMAQGGGEDVVGQLRRQRRRFDLIGIGQADDAVHPEAVAAAAHVAQQQPAPLRVGGFAAEAVAQVDDRHGAAAVMEQSGVAGVGAGNGGDVLRHGQNAVHRQCRHGTGDAADAEDQPGG
jgi:hypothetical protein